MTMRNMTPWKWGRSRVVPAAREATERYLEPLHYAMNELFREFTRSAFPGFGEEQGTFYPDVNMTEDEREVKVTAELPGMDENDIEISLTDETLTIKGEKKTEREEKGKESYYMERTFGSFQRVLPLSGRIDATKADATFKKGVLSITLPKLEAGKAESKKIRIKTT